jgi:hypothetical protein
MTTSFPADIQSSFNLIVKQLEFNFGDSLIGAYAQAFDGLNVVAVVEGPVTEQQKTNLYTAYTKILDRGIGLTIFSAEQIQQGHPYESSFSYDPTLSRDFVESVMETVNFPNPLIHTTLLRLMEKRGAALLGHPLRETLPTIGDDEYRLALRQEADAALRALPKSTAIQILTLCRILAFWRVGLMLPTQDVGAWAIKNLDPRFQTLIERATTERQSGNEPGAYNSYQLEQFAEYVRDMLLR